MDPGIPYSRYTLLPLDTEQPRGARVGLDLVGGRLVPHHAPRTDFVRARHAHRRHARKTHWDRTDSLCS
eukprot:scaffold244_cov416-Prasinococcus_capsulatus_cf.AAC.11